MEGVDVGGWPQQPKVFFSKLPYLQMPALQSWSGCQPVLLQAGCLCSCKYPYTPIGLNIGWRLFNDWLRISRYQISAHFTKISAIQWRLSYIAYIYLKIWRLSLQNISRCGPALKLDFWPGVQIWNVKYNFNGMFLRRIAPSTTNSIWLKFY